jgi:hypothetical protein
MITKQQYQEAQSLIKGYENQSAQNNINKWKKNQAATGRAKEKFNRIKPLITEYVKNNIKAGDIIRTKGYRGVKKVTEIDGDVYAMCGNMYKGQFNPNGSGSSTTIYYVTEVLRDGKFVKIKDLI